MLDRLAEIAPLSTWSLTLGAAALLLLGFVTFGHAKLVHGAYKESFRGVVAPYTLETMVRWTVVLLTGGLLLWGLALRWPTGVVAALGGVAGAALLLEGIARVRGGS